MKTLCCIIASAGVLASAPAMADQFSNATAFTNIWSSTQSTSNSYGAATALAESLAGSAIAAGAKSTLLGFKASGLTNSMTSSMAATSSNGNGYAQTQTSGYAGGTVSLTGAKGH